VKWVLMGCWGRYILDMPLVALFEEVEAVSDSSIRYHGISWVLSKSYGFLASRQCI
jgi:hypothetical protein